MKSFKNITKNEIREFNKHNKNELLVLINENGVHGQMYGGTFWLSKNEWTFIEINYRLNGNQIYKAIKK